MCMRRFAARYHQTISQDDGGNQMTIHGRYGEIYTYDDKYHMAALIDGSTANEWKRIKKKLKAAGCLMLEDGENGGVVVFELYYAKAAWAVIRVIEPVSGGATRPISRPLPKGASRSLFPDWNDYGLPLTCCHELTARGANPCPIVRRSFARVGNPMQT